MITVSVVRGEKVKVGDRVKFYCQAHDCFFEGMVQQIKHIYNKKPSISICRDDTNNTKHKYIQHLFTFRNFDKIEKI